MLFYSESLFLNMYYLFPIILNIFFCLLSNCIIVAFVNTDYKIDPSKRRVICFGYRGEQSL